MYVTPEQFRTAYDRVPQLVADYLASPQLGIFIRSIASEMGLHVDTAGELEQSVIHMLLGFMGPTELMAEMRDLGIVDPKASVIAKRINDAVFRPLHDRMRAESGKRVPANPPLTGVPAPLGTTPTAPPPAAAVAATPPAPRPVPPPRPEPVIPPAPFTPTPPRETRAPVMPTAATQPPAPIPKNYARDPYREPIDENPQH